MYVKTKRYKEAAAAFEEKLTFITDPSLEKTWLFHDLGRCFLELKNVEKALDNGQKSVAIADDLKDTRWGLNARLLIAQAYSKFLSLLIQILIYILIYPIAKNRDYTSAAETYEAALRNAKELSDDPAIRAITRALSDLNLLKDLKTTTSYKNAIAV
jgi:tetratricopeptide (TPR) repeat protein